MKRKQRFRRQNAVFAHNRLIFVKKKVFLYTKRGKSIAGSGNSPYLCIVKQTKRVPQVAGKFPEKDCFRLVVIFIVLGF